MGSGRGGQWNGEATFHTAVTTVGWIYFGFRVLLISIWFIYNRERSRGKGKLKNVQGGDEEGGGGAKEQMLPGTLYIWLVTVIY